MPATSGPAPIAEPPAIPDDIKYTPLWLRILAGWGWRLLVSAGVIALFWVVGKYLSQIVVPLLLALLITAGLSPLTNWLEKHRLPRWAGALVALLSMVLVFTGLLTLVGAQIAAQWQDLTTAATKGFSDLITWLGTGPFHISAEQMAAWVDQGLKALQDSRNQIATAVASAGSRIGAFFAGLATCLFAAFFFLKDGRRISGAFEKLLPTYAMGTIEPAVRGGWTSLASYVRAAVTVAAIDGVGAGLGALILGSNLWVAITAFTFVCSFIPLLGALIAGTVAVVVTLVTLGWVKAIVMLVIFVLVMNIEANVLQPLLLGRAVEIHPLLVLLGISAGAIVAGVAGALFAIPLIAFVSGAIRGMTGLFADGGVRRRVNVPWRHRSARPMRVSRSAGSPVTRATAEAADQPAARMADPVAAGPTEPPDGSLSSFYGAVDAGPAVPEIVDPGIGRAAGFVADPVAGSKPGTIPE